MPQPVVQAIPDNTSMLSTVAAKMQNSGGMPQGAGDSEKPIMRYMEASDAE